MKKEKNFTLRHLFVLSFNNKLIKLNKVKLVN